MLRMCSAPFSYLSERCCSLACANNHKKAHAHRAHTRLIVYNVITTANTSAQRTRYSISGLLLRWCFGITAFHLHSTNSLHKMHYINCIPPIPYIKCMPYIPPIAFLTSHQLHSTNSLHKMHSTNCIPPISYIKCIPPIAFHQFLT